MIDEQRQQSFKQDLDALEKKLRDFMDNHVFTKIENTKLELSQTNKFCKEINQLT